MTGAIHRSLGGVRREHRAFLTELADLQRLTSQPPTPGSAHSQLGRALGRFLDTWGPRLTTHLDTEERLVTPGVVHALPVETWTRDGLKVNAPSPVAHDLVIGGGYIRCYGQFLGHQDGIQVMGGKRITFRNLEVNCNTRTNAQLFIAGDFNHWNPTATPLRHDEHLNVWQACVPVPPGRYRYRLVVDGQWERDPYNSYVESNPFGELNSVVEVDT